MNNFDVENFVPDLDFFQKFLKVENDGRKKVRTLEEEIRFELLSAIENRDYSFLLCLPKDKNEEDIFVKRVTTEVERLGGRCEFEEVKCVTFTSSDGKDTLEEHGPTMCEYCEDCNSFSVSDSDNCTLYSVKQPSRYLSCIFDWAKVENGVHVSQVI